MYNVKDNAEAKLQNGISSIWKSLIVEDWENKKFPSVPFLAVLNHRDDDWNMTKMEIVEVVSQEWDLYKINRWQQGTQAVDFSAGDYLSVFVLAKHIQELQEWVNENKNSVWEINEQISSIQQDVSEIQKVWSIDHLEEVWIVWEKYTLEDDLFRQHTPKDEDSVVEMPVWNTNDNKEVHIQRIWSGIISNKLKLKIKLKWSPTVTLVAEVRKGVKVDVNDKEAYWYWQQSICSWSLPYVPFTHERQEVEFTMNKQFWWVEWELLDIIVYQQWKKVDAENYFILACDSTQYSEAFSCVRVNWNTRNREKLMPYAKSDWFTESLLCKINDERLEVGSMEEEIWSWSMNWTQTGIFATLTDTEFWVYNVFINSSWWQNTSFEIFVWGKKVEWFNVYKTSVNKEVIVDKGEKIELKCNTWLYTFSRRVFRKKFSLIKRAQKLLYPKNINNIWENMKVDSFWNFWERRCWEVNVNENYEKTEWSIPLTSVAWFITIRGNNWKILKIPFIK